MVNQKNIERFDFSKLTNENFWKEIILHSFDALVYTIRKFWYLFVLTSILAFIVAEFLYSLQIDKYHLDMTLRYGSIKNGLSSMSSGISGAGIGVGANVATLGAVENFGSSFSGSPTPTDTENNFGFNLKDFLIVVGGKFVQPESFSEKLRSKTARVTTFEAKSSSTLASLTATGADKKEVLDVAKKLSDYLENLFIERKKAILEKIDERLQFTKEEYKLISDQIKHIHKLEREFGRTSEIMTTKNTLYSQELAIRASLSEILSFKGDNYIKDFEILSISISSKPSKFLSRTTILGFTLLFNIILTAFGIVLLVFYRIKKIAGLNNLLDSEENNNNDKKNSSEIKNNSPKYSEQENHNDSKSISIIDGKAVIRPTEIENTVEKKNFYSKLDEKLKNKNHEKKKDE